MALSLAKPLDGCLVEEVDNACAGTTSEKVVHDVGILVRCSTDTTNFGFWHVVRRELLEIPGNHTRPIKLLHLEVREVGDVGAAADTTVGLADKAVHDTTKP